MTDKTVYLTPEGKQRFQAELRELTQVRRLEIEDRIRQAKEMADEVDDAAFEDAKNEQAFVEGRIRELERILASAQLIDEPARVDYVRMGCRVKVRLDDGEVEAYHIVGPQEADPRRGLVSNESPIGRALIGKRVGDETTVVAPGGSFRMVIEEIG